MDYLQAFLGLAVSLVAGGALSVFLENFDWWKNWKPNANIKSFVVLCFTTIVGGVLLFLQQWLVPQYFDNLPNDLKILLISIATFYMSQLVHSNRSA